MNIALRGTEDQLSSSSTSMKHLRCSVILVQTNQKVSLMIWWLIKRSFDFWEFKPQTLFLKYRSCQLILCDSGLFLKSGQRLVVVFFLSTTLMFHSGRMGAPLCTCNQSPLEGDEVTEKHLFFISTQGNRKNCRKTGRKKKTSGSKHFWWREHLRMWFDFHYLVEVLSKPFLRNHNMTVSKNRLYLI